MKMIEEKRVIVEDESSRNTSMVIVFLIAVAVIVGAALMMWQPWAYTAPSNSTTIIKETQTTAPAQRDTIIVPSAPPAENKTEIKIETPPPIINEGGSGSGSESGGSTSEGGGTSSEEGDGSSTPAPVESPVVEPGNL